jgi:hypothetical protein
MIFLRKISILAERTQSAFRHKVCARNVTGNLKATLPNIEKNMKKLYIIFLVLGILLLISVNYTLDFVTSIIPGWHTTIFPPYFIAQIILAPLFFVLAFVYWRSSKNKKL